jgi:peptide/nickel transport system substrate-binding protein
MTENKLNRRSFLKASALTALSGVLAACAQPTPQVIKETVVVEKPVEKIVKETVMVKETVQVKQTVVVEKTVQVEKVITATPKPMTYQEAPMLAALVKAGKLPPVAERLPIEPKVFKGMEGIGKYGGTMRRAFNGVSDRWGPTKLVDRGLTWFDDKFNIQPRLAKSWTVNATGSEWTFTLRKGVKWSDGQPMTSADFAWWYKNVAMNKELVPAGNAGAQYTSGAKSTPMTLETPDDYTVRFKFADPKPLFILGMGRQSPHAALGGPWVPAHYMKQFHNDFVTDKAAYEKTWKDLKFPTWVAYYIEKDNWTLNPDRPGIGPWIAKNKLSEEIYQMERNPYFWGVDEQGQQLPYIDKVNHRLFSTTDVKNLWVVNGEIDFQARHMIFSDYTLMKQGEAKGDYKVFVGISGGHTAIQVNHTTKEAKLREFFRTRDVRIAISLAVNRDEVNDLLFEGMATPRQYSPISKSAQFYPKLSNAYIKYDPKTANDLLDKAGYSKKGADGYRLWKDGSGPISFIIEGTDQTGTIGEDWVLVVCKYLKDVGLKATYKYAERSLYTQHYSANEIEAASWGGDRTVVPLVAPIIWLGQQPDRPWCPAWGFWYADPKNQNAEEPPADHWIRKIWDIWDNQVAKATESAKQNEYFFKILDIWAEEIPYPAFLGEAPTPIIVKNGFKGYLPGYPVDDPPGDEHLLNTETYYWDDPSKHGG